MQTFDRASRRAVHHITQSGHDCDVTERHVQTRSGGASTDWSRVSCRACLAHAIGVAVDVAAPSIGVDSLAGLWFLSRLSDDGRDLLLGRTREDASAETACVWVHVLRCAVADIARAA